MLEITLTWVSGYRRSHRGRDNAPFIRSIRHAPDQTYIRLQHLHCLFDLAIPPPFWIIAWIETIFMEFRGPKALVNLHGCRPASNSPLFDHSQDACAKCLPHAGNGVRQICSSLIPWCQARGSLEAIGPETGPEQRQAGSAGCSFGS